MILYNGASGSLGQYFAAALADAARSGYALQSRLEDRPGLHSELAELAERSHRITPGADVWFVQMAAKVSVPECERDPAAAHRSNVVDTAATVLDVVRWAGDLGARPHVVLVSSGHVYAAQHAGSRLRETDPLEPRSQYARTKLESEQRLTAQALERGYPLTIARVFGLIAPRQPANYMLQGLLRRARLQDLENIPGLSYQRDFLDARDVCRHLVQLCRRPDAAPATHILNLCSGNPVRLRDILAQLLELVHPARARQLLDRASEAPGRPDDIPWIVGDPSRFESALATKAQQTPLAATLRDAVR